VTFAQTPPGVKVSVAVDKVAYALGTEPIKVAATLENISGGEVLASDGLTLEPLAILLTFTDPNGQPIIADQLERETDDPPPPRVLPLAGELVQVDQLEILEPTFVQSVTVPDVRDLYTSLQAPPAEPGFYRVTCTVPVRTYAAIYRTVAGVDFAQLDTATFGGEITCPSTTFALFTDADGDGYFFPVPDPNGVTTVPDCDDGNVAVNPGATEVPGDGVDNDCNPATSDLIVIPPGIIAVEASQHTVGPGANPATSKGPLPDLPVHVYDKAAGSCAANFGFTHQQWKSIWLSCASSVLASGVTDAGGLLNLNVEPGSYLVLGQHDPDGGTPDDELYLGKSVNSLASGQTKMVDLRLLIKTNGSMNPGKSSKFTGSELWVIEPEYVEWNNTEELYPFIFETVGDWTVTTTVEPPEGFVADQNSLTTEVNTELKAAQFTITDVGSDWVDTQVTHDLTHKDKNNKVKKQKFKSKVGVKLSKGLAKAKGLTKWGKPKKEKKEK
jgi:hypothetical protein